MIGLVLSGSARQFIIDIIVAAPPLDTSAPPITIGFPPHLPQVKYSFIYLYN